MAGDFAVGSKLPPEAELAALFAVGRSSMREAVRALESAGYLRSAHGSGVYVTSDRPRTIAPLDQSLLGGFTMSDLFEARMALEGKAAELAAHRQTAHHREVIRSVLLAAGTETADDAEFVRLDGRFHRQVAEASGNPLILGLWDSIAAQFEEYSTKVIGLEGRRRRAHDGHVAIARAITAGDADTARRLAVEHVAMVQSELAAEEDRTLGRGSDQD